MSSQSLVPTATLTPLLSASKPEYLYEAIIIAKENKIPVTKVPFVNSYQVFQKA